MALPSLVLALLCVSAKLFVGVLALDRVVGGAPGLHVLPHIGVRVQEHVVVPVVDGVPGVLVVLEVGVLVAAGVQRCSLQKVSREQLGEVRAAPLQVHSVAIPLVHVVGLALSSSLLDLVGRVLVPVAVLVLVGDLQLLVVGVVVVLVIGIVLVHSLGQAPEAPALHACQLFPRATTAVPLCHCSTVGNPVLVFVLVGPVLGAMFLGALWRPRLVVQVLDPVGVLVGDAVQGLQVDQDVVVPVADPVLGATGLDAGRCHHSAVRALDHVVVLVGRADPGL